MNGYSGKIAATGAAAGIVALFVVACGGFWDDLPEPMPAWPTAPPSIMIYPSEVPIHPDTGDRLHVTGHDACAIYGFGCAWVTQVGEDPRRGAKEIGGSVPGDSAVYRSSCNWGLGSLPKVSPVVVYCEGIQAPANPAEWGK